MRTAFAFALAVLGIGQVAASPLWDYVNAPDPHYGYKDTGAIFKGTFPCEYTGHVLNLTSQAWLSSPFVSRSVWTHQLVVIEPAKINASVHTSNLYITGGGNDNPGMPNNSSEDVLMSAAMACATSTVAATLFQVPNAPIVWEDDPSHSERSEDAAVGWSWYEYINYQQDAPENVILFPMAKSAASAMTAVQDYSAKAFNHDINDFVVAGASKRGWTTWLIAACDKRVKAAAPIVMDMLNFSAGVMHMYQSYGGWTFAFKDYWDLNITADLTTPKMPMLTKQIDVLQYAENLTMPKLVIDSTGDEFFMPDDDHYWWGDLPGETYRLMIANAEHSMATGLGPLLEGYIAFTWSVILDTPRPEFTWDMKQLNDTTGMVTVTSKTKPNSAYMKAATSFWDDQGRRDFRLVKGDTKADPCHFIPVKIFGEACVNPVLWFWLELEQQRDAEGNYVYTAFLPPPPKGRYRALFVDMQYPGPNLSTFRMSTQVNIFPNTFPFPKCQGKQCLGQLV